MTQAKEIIFEEDARNKLIKGIDQVADILCSTLGPKGKNIGLDVPFGSPQITSDGNQIAKQIVLKDPFANVGAQLAQQVVSKIKETSGDGSTTGIALFHALVKEGIKNIAAGSSPIHIKRGMDKALEEFLKIIEQDALEIKNDQDIRNIAIVSASGDEIIGNYIADGMKKMNRFGVLTIEEGKGTETHIQTVEGLQFDKGYMSAYFSTDNHIHMDHPLILIVEKKLMPYKISSLYYNNARLPRKNY
jgi:chaperonin GroEL